MSILSDLRALLLLLSCLLSACISHEPRQLVPSISLSPEVVVLGPAGDGEAQRGGVNFGLVAAVNESDSLSNLTVLPGVRVRSVTPGGAAALAGIRPGDVILAVDERNTDHPDLLDAIALETRSAQTFNFRVRRNTTVFEATVNARPAVDERVAPVELYRADPVATRAGYTTVMLEGDSGQALSGARIVEIFPDSPLPAHNLATGDIILSLNGLAVQSAQGFINSIHNRHQLGETVSVTVARDGRTRTQQLRLWDPGRRLSRVALWPLFNYESSLVPDRTRFTILDLWLFSLFSYQQLEGEKEYEFLGIFRAESGYGELQEEP